MFSVTSRIYFALPIRFIVSILAHSIIILTSFIVFIVVFQMILLGNDIMYSSNPRMFTSLPSVPRQSRKKKISEGTWVHVEGIVLPCTYYFHGPNNYKCNVKKLFKKWKIFSITFCEFILFINTLAYIWRVPYSPTFVLRLWWEGANIRGRGLKLEFYGIAPISSLWL